MRVAVKIVAGIGRDVAAAEEPPMTAISAMLSTMSGAITSASAILVTGARAAIVTGSDAFRIAAMMAGTAWLSAGRAFWRGERGAAESVVAVDVAHDVAGLQQRAWAPRMDGMSVRPLTSQSRSALAVVCASETLPATVVIRMTSTNSLAPSAARIATASSLPGSVSMISGRHGHGCDPRLNIRRTARRRPAAAAHHEADGDLSRQRRSQAVEPVDQKGSGAAADLFGRDVDRG